MDESSAAQAHVWISGRVQGVFFRQTAMQAAQAYGVAGWVRNLPDGRVEAVFEGSRPAVEAMVGWASQGPPQAGVDRLELEWVSPQGNIGFTVRP